MNKPLIVPKVTVTVPVYNTSRYLRKCLDSLANQTLSDIEVILVDDGSTDGSGTICDEYAEKYDNFKVIHKPNGGLASARQVGLDTAQGEYVIVCDSDDWPEEDMYRRLYDEAKKSDADIVICGFYSEYKDGKSIASQLLLKSSNGVVDIHSLRRYGARSSWIQLVKRDLFKRANAEYVNGINLGEDSLIVLKLSRVNPKVVQIPDHLYHYRRLYGENSLTNSLKMSHVHQMYYVYDWAKDNFPEDTELQRRRAADIVVACMRVDDLDMTWFRALLKNDLSWKMLFQKPLFLKSGVVAVIKTLPFKLSKRIFRLLYPFVYN